MEAVWGFGVPHSVVSGSKRLLIRDGGMVALIYHKEFTLNAQVHVSMGNFRLSLVFAFHCK